MKTIKNPPKFFVGLALGAAVFLSWAVSNPGEALALCQGLERAFLASDLVSHFTHATCSIACF